MLDQNIAFRVDASNQIGTGHLMRCLTLADAFKQDGARTQFVSRHISAPLRELLAVKGHEFKLINSSRNIPDRSDLAHAEWLGTSQQADAQDTVRVLAEEPCDWLVVDHYALDARWESVLHHVAKKILVIDDIADRQHDCDVLLDQNFYMDMNTRYAGKVPEHCRMFLGPRYALLRNEFQQIRNQIQPRSGPVKRILIFFGGVDAGNYTSLAIQALMNIDVSGIHVDVVIGAQHPFRSLIETTCIRSKFACHVQTDRMAELMAAADISIGAGGSATWERCSVGLPSILLVLAENQRQAVIALEAIGALISLGDANQVTAGELAGAVTYLINDEGKRSELSRKSLKLMSLTQQWNVMELLGDKNA